MSDTEFVDRGTPKNVGHWTWDVTLLPQVDITLTRLIKNRTLTRDNAVSVTWHQGIQDFHFYKRRIHKGCRGLHKVTKQGFNEWNYIHIHRKIIE